MKWTAVRRIVVYHTNKKQTLYGVKNMADKKDVFHNRVKNNVYFLENASSFRNAFIVLFNYNKGNPSAKNTLPLLYIFSQTLENFFKSYILLFSDENPKKLGHNLNELYKKAKDLNFYCISYLDDMDNHSLDINIMKEQETIRNNLMEEKITELLKEISSFHSVEGDYSNRYILTTEDEKYRPYPILENDELINILGDIERKVRHRKDLLLVGENEKYKNMRISWNAKIA